MRQSDKNHPGGLLEKLRDAKSKQHQMEEPINHYEKQFNERKI